MSYLTIVQSAFFNYSLVFVGVCVLYKWMTKRGFRLPPGPRGLPLLGYAPFVDRNLAKQTVDLSVKYRSPTVYLHLGPTPFLFLNTFDTIKEAFAKNGGLFNDRPNTFFKKYLMKGMGILGADGPCWKKQRSFTLKVLKDFGMGNFRMETRVLDEVEHLTRVIKFENFRPIRTESLMSTASSNVISALVFGKRREYDDREFASFMASLECVMGKISFVSVLNYFPFLRHFPGDPLGFFHIQSVSNDIDDYIRDNINQHRKYFQNNNIDDFVDAYLQEMKQGEDDSRASIDTRDEREMVQVVRDLFVAGSKSVAITLRWAILYMSRNPHVQKKVQQEIDTVIDVKSSSMVTTDHWKHLLYTRATINECHRVATIMPFGVPHSNNQYDVILGNHDVPKETIVMANIWAVHHDPKVWKYPNSFDPTNFLDEAGTEMINEDAIIPFSIGRRACIGDALAKVELFIFFANILRSFQLELYENDSDIDMKGIEGILIQPPPHHIIFSPRI